VSSWADGILPRLAALGLDKRLPVLVALLLTIMLAQSLAVLTWELLPQPQVEDETSLVSSTRSTVPAGTTGKNQVRQISQWHLFGEVQKVAPAAVAKVTDAPDTRLNLKLRGVLASSDPAFALAIIADGKGKEDAYALESKLPGNAVLKEIYADRVILEYRGRLEALRLPREAIASAGPKPAKLIRGGSSGLKTSPVRSVRNAGTSALLRQYREAMINDPQSLMNLVSASPVVDKSTGRLKGYRIRPGKDRRLLRKFGLKNGDVVTAVNGVSLDNPIKALEIMRELTTASSVSLDVERKGQMQSFSFQID
jgi:general secretion pathway protein C